MTVKPIARLVLLLAFIFGQPLFAQWTWQNPLPQGNTLHAVHFIDASAG